jgi:hypothetical protein
MKLFSSANVVTPPSPSTERQAIAELFPTPAPTDPGTRPRVGGKFLFLGDEKLYVRGVTYGTFHPNDDGQEFHDPARVEADFAAMAANGLNALRTYTVPPRWLLDAAQRHGLRVMVGLTWEQHVTFLDDRKRARDIEQRVRAGVRACARHPAVLCYAIGNEIPASIVRWHGARPVERYIERLYTAAKDEDPGALITYVNYPSTEYLQLPFLDLICFNVYLESQERLDTHKSSFRTLALPAGSFRSTGVTGLALSEHCIYAVVQTGLLGQPCLLVLDRGDLTLVSQYAFRSALDVHSLWSS